MEPADDDVPISEVDEKFVLGEKRSSYRQKWEPFRKASSTLAISGVAHVPLDEICTLEEFYEKTECGKNISFDGWTFQAIDFSCVPVGEWNQYNFKGALFLGCNFPVPIIEVQKKGGEVWSEPCKCPFKSFRSHLYTQQELKTIDHDTYQHYLTNTDFRTKISQSIHDYSLTDALGDYLEGKVAVGIMGGHKLLRASAEYRQVVLLALGLARKGFLICTGGGPGAMEAANLGGYLYNKTEEQIELALKLIASGGDIQPEYIDFGPPNAVLEALGQPEPSSPSLGIPTYRYGHEPTNYFSSHIAKFFDNAIREDGLLQISNGGLIFIRGAAGTRQEIFQSACHNHYNTPKNSIPMVFVGKEFWGSNGVFELFHQFASTEFYGKYTLLSDDQDEVINLLVKHAAEKELHITPPTM